MTLRSRRGLAPALRDGLPTNLERVVWGGELIDRDGLIASAGDRFFAGVGPAPTGHLRNVVDWLWRCAVALAVGELSRHAPPQRGGCV